MVFTWRRGRSHVNCAQQFSKVKLFFLNEKDESVIILSFPMHLLSVDI